MTREEFERIYELLEEIREGIWQRYQGLKKKSISGEVMAIREYIPIPTPHYDNAKERELTICGKLLDTNMHYIIPFYANYMEEEPPTRERMMPADMNDELNYMEEIVYRLSEADPFRPLAAVHDMDIVKRLEAYHDCLLWSTKVRKKI